MERTKYLLTLFLALSCPMLYGSLYGSFNGSFNGLLYGLLYGEEHPDIYRAYISGDMALWRETLNRLEAMRPQSSDQQLQLIDYHYGYIGWCLSQKRDEEAKGHLKRAKSLLKPLEQAGFRLPLLFAYKAAFAGFEIGLSPIKAPLIGPQSIAWAKKSVALDSTLAMGYLQLGNIAYYAPKIFGGSPSEGIKQYEKALRIIEKSPEQRKQRWHHLHILETLINASLTEKETEKAERYIRMIERIEPQFNWEQHNLYLQAKKLMIL